MEPLKSYNVTVSYMQPAFLTLTVSGKDEEEIVEKVQQTMHRFADVEIVDIVNIDNAPAIKEIIETIRAEMEMSNKPVGGLN